MICPQCQRRYPPGTLLCLQDGTRLQRSDAADATPGSARTAITTVSSLESPAADTGKLSEQTAATEAARPRARPGMHQPPPTESDPGATQDLKKRPPPVLGGAAQRNESTSGGPARASEPDLAVADTHLALATTRPLTPGTKLGEYEISGVLGAGGMATVYAGVHPLIGKRVAIKVLHSRYARDPQIAERFLREAQAVNQIDSEFLVNIFAVGTLDDGRQYLVMDYLEGESLSTLINREHPLPLPLVLQIFTDVARGLAVAHDAGIVHRDLKPSNIMVRRLDDGRVLTRIVDFGIAKLLYSGEGEEGAKVESWSTTQTGIAIGTGPYMSPEQIGGEVDRRTDIWALGVSLFRALTGVLPFDADSFADLVELHRRPTPRASERREDVPQGLEALIERCLFRDRHARPQSMSEVLEALLALASSDEAPPPEPELLPAVPRNKTPWVVGGVALLLLGAAAGATIALWPRGAEDPPPASRPAVASKTLVGPRGAPEKRFASLTIETGIETATYTMDGALVGAGATLHLPQLPAGDHALVIAAPGYESQPRKLRAFGGSVWKLRITLRKLARAKRKRPAGKRAPRKRPTAKTAPAATKAPPARRDAGTDSLRGSRTRARGGTVTLAPRGRLARLTPRLRTAIVDSRRCDRSKLPLELRQRQLKPARLMDGSYAAYALRPGESSAGPNPLRQLRSEMKRLAASVTTCLRAHAGCAPQLWDLRLNVTLGPSGAVKRLGITSTHGGKTPDPLNRCLGPLFLKKARLPPPRPGRRPQLVLKLRAF